MTKNENELLHLWHTPPDSYGNRSILQFGSHEICRSYDHESIEMLKTTLIVTGRYSRDDLKTECTVYERGDDGCHYCENPTSRFDEYFDNLANNKKIETQDRLDDAVIAAVESGKILFGETTFAKIEISDSLTLEFKSPKMPRGLLDEPDKEGAPYWMLIKNAPGAPVSDEIFFPLGHMVTKALDKIRNSKLKNIEESKESKVTAEYNEIIDEIKGIE